MIAGASQAKNILEFRQAIIVSRAYMPGLPVLPGKALGPGVERKTASEIKTDDNRGKKEKKRKGKQSQKHYMVSDSLPIYQ